MIQLPWLATGLLFGLLIATVLIPPTRKEKRVPQPNDSSVFHTESGCVRFESVEVPCVKGADSMNLLAGLSKKQ